MNPSPALRFTQKASAVLPAACLRLASRSPAVQISSVPLPRSPAKPALLVLVALGVATLLKALWAVRSVGSYDAAMFYLFAKNLHTHSLGSLYAMGPDFNHTPATAWLIRGLFEAAQGNYRLFASWLRFLCIGADAAVVLGLLRMQRRWPALPTWALVAFALSPVSIMVSGFHGNVDPLMTALLFGAALAAGYEAPLVCGVLLGAACNIKIVPIVLGPVFFCYWLARGRRAVLRFSVPAAAALALGFGWPLLVLGPVLLRNVFGYGGYWGAWGITYGLRLTGWNGLQQVGFAGLPLAERSVMLGLKLFTVSAVIALAWWRRRGDARVLFGTLALAFAVIYTFAPGGAAQYMVWFAPFLLVESPRWWAAATLAATVFLCAFYSASAHGPFPWFVVFPKTGEEETWIPWTIPAWGVFTALLVTQLRAGWIGIAQRQLRFSSGEASL